MEPKTHASIDRDLCGTPVELGEGAATVELLTHPRMGADTRGLVHGGFIFGVADYAAMLAINDPHVVLGSAEVKFTKPVVVGQRLRAQARARGPIERKTEIDVDVICEGQTVFRGTFTCMVPRAHVLDL